MCEVSECYNILLKKCSNISVTQAVQVTTVVLVYFYRSESPKYPHSQTSPQPMSTYQPKEMPKVVLKGRGHHFVKRKPKMDDDDDDEDGYFDEDEDDYNDEDEEEEAEGYKDDYDVDDKEDDKKVEHESKLEMPTPKRDMSKTRRRRNKVLVPNSYTLVL